MARSLIGPATPPFPVTVFDNTGGEAAPLPTLAGILQVGPFHRDYLVSGLGGVADTVQFIEGGVVGSRISLWLASAAAPITLLGSDALSNLDLLEPLLLANVERPISLVRSESGWSLDGGADSEAEVVGTATVDGNGDTITVGNFDLIDVTVTGGPWTGTILSAGTVNRQRVGIRNTSATTPIQYDKTEATSRVDGSVERNIQPPNAIQYFEWGTTTSRWFPVGHELLHGSVTVTDGASPTFNPTNAEFLRITPVANRTGASIAAGVIDGQRVTIANVATAFSVTFDTTEATSRVLGSEASNMIPASAAFDFEWDAALGRWHALSALLRSAAQTIDVNAVGPEIDIAFQVHDLTSAAGAESGNTMLPAAVGMDFDSGLHLIRASDVSGGAITLEADGAASFLIGDGTAPGVGSLLSFATAGDYVLVAPEGADWRVLSYFFAEDTVVAAGTAHALSPVTLCTPAAPGVVNLPDGIFVGQRKTLRQTNGNASTVTPAGATRFAVEDNNAIATIVLPATDDFLDLVCTVPGAGGIWTVVRYGIDADTVVAAGTCHALSRVSLCGPAAPGNVTLDPGVFAGQRKTLRQSTANASTIQYATSVGYKGGTLATGTIVLATTGDQADFVWQGARWNLLELSLTSDVVANGATVHALTETTLIITAAAGVVTVPAGLYTSQRKIIAASDLTLGAATVTPAAGSFDLHDGTVASVVLTGNADYMELVRGNSAYRIAELHLGPDTVAQGGTANALTPVTYVATTGAGNVTVPDGEYTGQRKTYRMTVDAGDATLMPDTAFVVEGATVASHVLANVGDYIDLVWNGVAYAVVSFGGDADVVTDSVALSLSTKTSHLVTTGAAVPTLADGYEGQLKHVVMVTDAGNAVLTPATPAADYATIHFTQVGHSALLLFKNAAWHFLGGTAHLVQTAQSLVGSGAVSLETLITEWDTTGGGAGTLADGVEGQRKIVTCVTFSVLGTLTPDNPSPEYSTITFGQAGETAELLFTDGDWTFVGGTAHVNPATAEETIDLDTPGADVAANLNIPLHLLTGDNAAVWGATLADGRYIGEEHAFFFGTNNGFGTDVTPATTLGAWVAVTFANAGQGCILKWTTSGWYIAALIPDASDTMPLVS